MVGKSKRVKQIEFLEEERGLDEEYTGQGRRLHMNRGLIDRKGKVVRPDREEHYRQKPENKYRTQYEERQKRRYHGIFSISGFVLGMVFLSSVVANSGVQLSPSQSIINWNLLAGILLIIVSLVEGYMWFKLK